MVFSLCIIFVCLIVKIVEVNSFIIIYKNQIRLLRNINGLKLLNSKNNDEQKEEMNERDDTVEVGSKEYYKGFLETDLSDDRSSDGLEQTLKLAGSAASILAVLFLLFLKSNDLI